MSYAWRWEKLPIQKEEEVSSEGEFCTDCAVVIIANLGKMLMFLKLVAHLSIVSIDFAF